MTRAENRYRTRLIGDVGIAIKIKILHWAGVSLIFFLGIRVWFDKLLSVSRIRLG